MSLSYKSPKYEIINHVFQNICTLQNGLNVRLHICGGYMRTFTPSRGFSILDNIILSPDEVQHIPVCYYNTTHISLLLYYWTTFQYLISKTSEIRCTRHVKVAWQTVLASEDSCISSPITNGLLTLCFKAKMCQLNMYMYAWMSPGATTT